MVHILWASALLVHAQLTMASDAACENVASEMTSEFQPSLLQLDQQTGRYPLAPRKTIIELSLPDVFLYDHLPKAGGSFIRSIFEKPDYAGKIIPKENYRMVDEGHTLTADMRRETFTVGSVRNPCEYYVSNWAFFGKINFLGKEPDFFGVSENLDTHEDQLRFQKWLHWMRPDAKPPGLLTSRVLWSYFGESVAGARRPPDSTPHEPPIVDDPISSSLNGPWTEAERAIYVAAADKIDPSTVDCWIKTENIASDLRKCLELFEQQAGSKVVNWVEFNKTIEQREKQHDELKFHDDGFVWTKNSGHAKCNFYFDDNDPSLKEYVYKLDHAIFDKFGYTGCCSSNER